MPTVASCPVTSLWLLDMLSTRLVATDPDTPSHPPTRPPHVLVFSEPVRMKGRDWAAPESLPESDTVTRPRTSIMMQYYSIHDVLCEYVRIEVGIAFVHTLARLNRIDPYTQPHRKSTNRCNFGLTFRLVRFKHLSGLLAVYEAVLLSPCEDAQIRRS